MPILTLFRQSIPLFIFVMGMMAWVFIPSHFGALEFQSKAFFTFFLSLTVLSCLLLPLRARFMEILKIGVYVLFFITFILTLEPFYRTFLEGKIIYSRLVLSYHPDKALGMMLSWLQRRLATHYEFYGIWLGFSGVPVLLLCYFFHLLWFLFLEKERLKVILFYF